MTTRLMVVVLLMRCLLTPFGAPPLQAQHVRLGSRVATVTLSDESVGVDQLNEIATNGRNRVIASETISRDLLVFTSDGHLLSRSPMLAKHTASPGAIAFLSSTTFAVMDRGGPHAIWGRLMKDSAQFMADGGPDIGATSGACELNGDLVVAGFSGPPGKSKILHEVASRGTIVRSFGAPIGGADWAADLLYAPSVILCTTTPARVTIASQTSGEVRAITEAGTERWAFTPPDFVGMSLSTPQPGTMLYAWPADSLWDMIETVFTPASGVVAIQVAHLRGRQPRTALSVVTYFVAGESGRLLGSQSDLPLVRAVLPERLYTAGSDLKPSSLTIYAFTWSAR